MELDAGDGRGILSGPARGQARGPLSTLRGYHSALRAFTSYISNPDYGWDRICEQHFGTHPAQVFFEWNTAPHVQAYDGRASKRPYTREELDALFEHADKEVERIGKSSKKGWQAAYRDAVRYGESRRSSPHKPRSVLTVWRWTPGILEDWLANGRGDPGTLDLFPSERGGLVVESTLLRRLRRYCDELQLSDGLDLHSFRRSYATHLLEAGWDPRFVQDQMGHEYASTTGIYEFVSDEFRRSTLRAALDRTVVEALGRSNKGGTP